MVLASARQYPPTSVSMRFKGLGFRDVGADWCAFRSPSRGVRLMVSPSLISAVTFEVQGSKGFRGLGALGLYGFRALEL